MTEDRGPAGDKSMGPHHESSNPVLQLMAYLSFSFSVAFF